MHEILEIVLVVRKPTAKIIRKICGYDQFAFRCRAEAQQSVIEVDTVGRWILRDSVQVNGPHHLRCHDGFEEAAARQICAHRTLQLELSRACVTDTDLLSDDLTVGRVLK